MADKCEKQRKVVEVEEDLLKTWVSNIFQKFSGESLISGGSQTDSGETNKSHNFWLYLFELFDLK